MTVIGIDIGTGSVRSYCDSATRVVSITVTHNETNPHVITQSSAEILDAIRKTAFGNINADTASTRDADINALSISATCSMVVRERVLIDGTTYLKPFSVNGEDPDQDIILWMDNRAVKQTSHLNQLLESSPIMPKLGGKIIPEMGIPKLLWLHDNFPESDLVVFEMYDWFSLVLINGLVSVNGVDLVRYNEQENNSLCGQSTTYSESMDGSIKGWDFTSVYDQLKISRKIHIGTLKAVSECLLPPIGTYIGDVCSQFATKPIRVAHGCIDCYGGWISTLVDPQKLVHGRAGAGGTLSVVAGTSTCYLLSLDLTVAMPGVWGPFKQLLGPEFLSIFEFGQPATGKLFESLYGQYKLILGIESFAEFFDLMNKETIELESQYGTDISIVLKDYFYYGDKYGNRSPFNEFTMNEILMNGSNSETVSLPNLLEESSTTVVCMKYNLILEFLVLQMKQIVSQIEAKSAPIESVVISGSQANNKRFVSLIKRMMQEKNVCIVGDGQGKYTVARGAAIVASLATKDASPSEVVSTIRQFNNQLEISDVGLAAGPDPTAVLQVKFWFLQQLSDLQSQYRSRMRAQIGG